MYKNKFETDLDDEFLELFADWFWLPYSYVFALGVY